MSYSFGESAIPGRRTRERAGRVGDDAPGTRFIEVLVNVYQARRDEAPGQVHYALVYHREGSADCCYATACVDFKIEAFRMARARLLH